MSYKYETHCHTFPCSACSRATVRDTLTFYKEKGYDGVFLSNHFIDGNTTIPKNNSYEDRVRFYFAEYKKAKKIGDEIGIKVFDAQELTYAGTDFLVFGLHEDWWLAHPEVDTMTKKKELPYLMENGGLVVQAHPFRQADYIDHIRLYPDGVQGVEVFNACRTELENKMAEIYAENYNFVRTAGSDNHSGSKVKKLGWMEFDTPISDEADFIRRVLATEGTIKKEVINL